MAVKKVEEVVEIRPIEMAETKIKVVGDSPLIVHAFSAKAKRQILEKEIGATKTKGRDVKNPIEDFASSMYWLTPMPTVFTEDAMDEALKDARFGFKVVSFKEAAIMAAYREGWVKNTTGLRGSFFIVPEFETYFGGDLEIDYDKKKIEIIPNCIMREQLVEIKGSSPVMREDMVRLQGIGSPADIRYRGEFPEWSAELTIRYNKNGQFSFEQIVNCINLGGLSCGVGEWRPEKSGQYGQYHVEAA